MTRRAAGILLGLYLVALGFVAAWPTPVDRPVDNQLFRLLDRLQEAGFGWLSYSFVQFTANLVLFLPFGLLLAALAGRGWAWLALSCAVATTFSIEFLQLQFLPARRADVADLAANSLGAAIGVALVVLAGSVPRRRRRPRSLDG